MKDDSKIGVILANLGSPDSPTPEAVRRYLKQFLSDPRVVQINRLLWWVILNGIILNIRPKRVAEAYRSVWTEEGSPLISISKAQHRAVADNLNSVYGDRVHCEVAMTYGNPSIDKAIEKMKTFGVSKLLVFPLYPQFSFTTSAAVSDAVDRALENQNYTPEVKTIHNYHDHPAYIENLAESVKAQWKSQRSQLLVFSLHGIPLRYVNDGDPYRYQCQKTTKLVAEALQLKGHQWRLVFQSRFGREPWLQPYCDETMENLPGEGVESIDILCPGFSADCLETLEEIQVENRDIFLEAGGKSFNYIPCLNDKPSHTEMLTDIVRSNLTDWI